MATRRRDQKKVILGGCALALPGLKLRMLIRFSLTLWVCYSVASCGGVTSSDSTSTAGVGGTASSSGGASSNLGGTGGASGAAGASSCTPVSFQVVPAPNSNWCLGQPGGCESGYSILGPSGALQLGSLCDTQCDTCTWGLCPPVACVPASPLADSGVSYSWNGQYFVSGNTCGASATPCMAPVCAAAGPYKFRTCGFANPDPTNANSCSLLTTLTPYGCTDFDFDYPFTGVKTFVWSN